MFPAQAAKVPRHSSCMGFLLVTGHDSSVISNSTTTSASRQRQEIYLLFLFLASEQELHACILNY
jgi:hypothetical protein